MSAALLGGLSPARFLADHWQRRPLLVRGAWPGFVDPLSPEELAGLACEQEVGSRLVQSAGGVWRLRYGPFEERDFQDLPEAAWTLLVQDVEKHLPDLTTLLRPFRFLPDWRVDDLMISYAAREGTVGPHWDDYDVFLLQGMGRRRWQISERPVEGFRVDDGDGLRLIADFSPDREWLLDPGDMLYLPPRVAHHGVACEPCMTYSIGFRAPALRDMVAGFGEYLSERLAAELRFSDPGRAPAGAEPGRIGTADLDRVAALLRRGLSWRDEQLADWFGRHVSETATEPPPPASRPVDLAGLRRLLAEHGLARAAGVRLVYHRRPDEVWLFAAGERWRLAGGGVALAPLLCGRQRYDGGSLSPLLDEPSAAAALLALVERGYLCPRDPEQHRDQDQQDEPT